MKYVPLIARVCLALVFANAGIKHALGFGGFVDGISQTLPLAPLLAAGTVAFQLLGALSLILGYQVKIGALLLIIFLVPANLIFHNFLIDGAELGAFLKNLGLIGGLLMVIYTGSGPISLEGRTS